jgi:predicted phage terminase large subunit-like protein
VREADHTIRHDSDGQTMIRIDDGGLLWPEREGPQEIAERKLNLGSMAFASQYQQRPSPLGGALFKSAWFRHWQTLPAMDRKIMVVDTAYSEAQQADFSNIDIWGQADAGFFLIANAHQRCEFPELKRLSIWMAANHRPELILIEPRASGLSLIQELKRSGPVATTEPGVHFSMPVVPLKVPAGQDKLARATAVTPVVEAGLVWLPDPSIAAWVDDYEREVTTFPGAAHDDRVDCMVYALQYLRSTGNVVDFYRRHEAYQRAVEDARAEGRKPPPPPSNSALESYQRSVAKWTKVFNPDN